MIGSIRILFFVFSFCSCEGTDMIRMTDLSNLRLSDSVSVSAMLSSSVLRCAVTCTSNLSCMSLSYHDDTRRCLIYDFLFSSDTPGAITESGWRSYRKYSASCPADYTYNLGLDWCYRVITEPKRRTSAASDYCNLEGARLIRIDSMEKQKHITTYLLSEGVNSVYIAGRADNRDNNFIYEDGTALPFTYWDTNNPRGLPCISIVLVGSSYVWGNGHGTISRAFMCEM